MAPIVEFTRETGAPVSDVWDYFCRIEDVPKVHPSFVRKLTVLKRTNDDDLTVEQQSEIMGRKVWNVNRIVRNREERKIVISTIEGQGKGSSLTLSLKEVPNGTQIIYHSEFDYGRLGFFVEGAAKSVMEKIADEDVSALSTASPSRNLF